MTLVRWLLTALIRAHPEAFRERFGTELLEIYLVTAEAGSPMRAVADAILSFALQWIRASVGERAVRLEPVFAPPAYVDLTEGPGIVRIGQAVLILALGLAVWSSLGHPARVAKPYASDVVPLTLR